nr:MAG TPA: Cell surface protein [Caudoviricetes sp.]
MKGDYIMAEELNVNVTGINLPPLKVEGTFTVPAINILGQNGKSAYELWLESGNSGTREDFLNSLKGQDGRNGNNGLPGKDASAQGSYEMLMGLNVYCENATPDEVLKGLIRGLGDMIKKPFKPLEFDRPQKGQSYINVYGTPHFKVAILGKGAAFGASINDNGRGRLDLDSPFMANDIEVEYFNMLGNIVGTYRVSGYSDGKTEIAAHEFSDDDGTTTYEFPEVISVGAQAFHGNTETVKLPKATRIDKQAFINCFSLVTLELPSFVFTEDNQFDWARMYELRTLVLNDATDINIVDAIAKQLTDATIYNQDKSKKFDKGTKSWVPVQ